MIREYIGRRLGALLVNLLLSCICTKEDLQDYADLEKKRERAKIWQQPDLRETSPEALFEDDPSELGYGDFKVGFRNLGADALWDCLDGAQRGLFVTKAERNERWNTRKLAKFNARIPLDPSIEKLPDCKFDNRVVSKSKCLGLQRWNRYRHDHHKACGRSKLPVPKRPFRFLDLPLELRQEVYKLVLSQKRQIFQYPPDGSASTVNGPVDVRIFAVSKAVYEETIAIFYQVNTFAIDIDNLPLFIHKSTRDIPQRPTELLRKVHIGLLFKRKKSGFAWYGPSKAIFENIQGKEPNWTRLRLLLESCRRLVSVEITVYYAGSEKATHLVTSCAEINSIYEKLVTSQINADLGCANQERIWVGRHEERQWQDGLIRDVMGFTSIHAPPYIRLAR
ncbi:hypothetical protein OEA41_009914 [Lepraria neglecta]|uniref:Uncharacterized protein n=1 Tax=Lepraria neglecta TaxID=209136 RepID=A0AAD9YVL0_9LECA|nr:hypothetical protein OEA41_009914 [Lepraria neglecta]